MPVQWQEDLPVRELSRQLMGGVHGECRLADPGHPADRVYARHSGRPRPARRPGRAASPGGRLELRPVRAGEIERAGESARRIRPGGLCHATLEVADRPRADARPVSQFLLGQPGIRAQLPEHPGERRRWRLSHGPG